jgi:aldehyde dehydrogenase (NAD+)
VLAEAVIPRSAVRAGQLRNHVNGAWVDPSGEGTLLDLDPSDPSKPLVDCAASSPQDAAAALAAAAGAQAQWARTTVIARAQILLAAAAAIRARADAIGALITTEEGKPLPEARAEAVRTAETLEALAALGYAPQGDVFGGHRTEQWVLSRRVPIGVAVIIAPWNFPLLIPAWKVGAALLSGNAVVLKPADPTPLTAALLVEVLQDAGVPPGVLNFVHGRGSVLGPALLRAPAAAVSFTGGNAAGATVARAATEHHLKAQLELGGNNAVLVMADADLDHAAREIVTGAMASTGQKCTATQRVFVEASAIVGLRERVVDLLAATQLGPGLDPATTVGPLVNAAARDEFEAAVAGMAAGASRVSRFGALPDVGFYGQPTLLEHDAWDRGRDGVEVFGPLLALFGVDSLEEGIARCNDTPYGLSASVFTGAIGTALQFADSIAAGVVHVNSQTPGSEPQVPFGGFKRSSNYSRELGRSSWEFFTQVQSVYLEGS